MAKKKEPTGLAKMSEKPLMGKVKTVDVQHALRASLQFEQSDGSRTASYSSIEVLINMHIEVPEEFQTGNKFKEIVDAYAAETLQMVDERIKKDARRLGLVSITETPKIDEEVKPSGDLISLDVGPTKA